MRRVFYVGVLYLLFNALFCVPAFAADWEVYSPDIRESADEGNSLDGFDDFYEWQDYMDSLASPSVATRSNVIRMPPSAPALYSNYTPYDSSISTAVIQYMRCRRLAMCHMCCSDRVSILIGWCMLMICNVMVTSLPLLMLIILLMIPVITRGILAQKVLLLYVLIAILCILILGGIRSLLGIPCIYMPFCF